MATIGSFKKSENGDYAGAVKTLTLNVKARITPVEKTNDKAPGLPYLRAAGARGGIALARRRGPAGRPLRASWAARPAGRDDGRRGVRGSTLGLDPGATRERGHLHKGVPCCRYTGSVLVAFWRAPRAQVA